MSAAAMFVVLPLLIDLSSGAPSLRGIGAGSTESESPAPRSLEAVLDDTSIIEFVGEENVERYEWSHQIGGQYTKTRILHRPSWQKTYRCANESAGSCEECWDEENCWAPGSGSRSVQTSANSSWVRFVNSIHVQCSSASILLNYKATNLQGGSLQFFVDGQDISGAAGFVAPVSEAEFAGSVSIPVEHTGGHTLDIQFTSNGGANAGVEFSELRLQMPNEFAECEDFKVCLDTMSGSDEAVQQLRGSNVLQLECLEQPVALSPACAMWRGCLTMEREVALYSLLKAANVHAAASGRRTSEASSSTTTDSPTTTSTTEAPADSVATEFCLNPSTADAEAWTCDCYDEMKAQCSSVGATEEVCIKAQMCGHARVCEEWKQGAGCNDPEVVAALDALSVRRRLFERSMSPAVAGASAAEAKFDRALGSKRCN